MYKIGFDAKRAFKNYSGLGNYSRLLISSLSQYYNYNLYTLFTPPYAQNTLVDFDVNKNIKIIKPTGINRRLTNLWRSYNIAADIEKEELDLYHGLSGELPIKNIKAAKVVTIHDLIFLRHPQFYKPLDRWFYRKKAQHAVNNADKIIAISKQTADDIQNFFGIDKSKIEIIYQGCHPQFYQKATQQSIDYVQQKYNFPKRFIVAMGTIEQRKNVGSIVKALVNLPKDVVLYCFGRKTNYVYTVNRLAAKYGVKDRVIMIHDAHFSEIPAIYSLAQCLLYVSLFEGFGIPVLEGITYGIPVITSGGSSMQEAGGDSVMYVNPDSPTDIKDKIELILSSPTLRGSLIERGYTHAKLFRNDKVADKIFEVYKQTIELHKTKL